MIKVKPITNKELREFVDAYSEATVRFQATFSPDPIVKFHFSSMVPDDTIFYGDEIDKIVAHHHFPHFVPGRHKGFIAAENLRSIIEKLFGEKE